MTLGLKPRQCAKSVRALDTSLSWQPEPCLEEALKTFPCPPPSHSGPMLTSLFTIAYIAPHLVHSECGLPGRGSKSRSPGLVPDLLNLNPHFNNSPQGFPCRFKYAKGYLPNLASGLTDFISYQYPYFSLSVPALLASFYFSRIPHTIPPPRLCTCCVLCL